MKHIMKYLHLTCDEPFEKFWMINYIDEKLIEADMEYEIIEKAMDERATDSIHLDVPFVTFDCRKMDDKDKNRSSNHDDIM